MVPVFPAATTALAVVLMLASVLFAARFVQPRWWRSRPFRYGVFVVFGAMFAGLGVWALGRGAHELAVVHAGAAVAYVGVLSLFPAAALMPFGAGIDRIASRPRARARVTRRGERGAEVSRRSLLRFGGGALPAAAAVTAASGFVTAKQDPKLPVIRMRYPGLHPDLDGLRILQLSDLHLGVDLGLPDLERGLARAMEVHRPDLIVVTGDLADDPALIEPALARIAAARARLGVFASLGNHEYLHGIRTTRPAYERSSVPLLVSTGRAVRVGRATLFVGGADDPVHMGGDIARMLEPSIASAAARAPRDADFRLLLCHRPEGFGPAAAHGFDLTLSGHTHGGQLGFMGRSLLEKLRPGVPWWGAYARERGRGVGGGGRATSRLYTTSGFGHWFPYRLGCPTEMPLVVLDGGVSPSADPQRFAARRGTVTRGS